MTAQDTLLAVGRRRIGRAGLLLLAPVLVACSQLEGEGAATTVATAPCPTQPDGEVALPGGAFEMGADPLRNEEGPPRRVSVGAFSMDRTEVTSAQFAEFVRATGYVTLAEQAPDPTLYPGVDPDRLKPSSLVFAAPKTDADLRDMNGWWRIVDGAQWRYPSGPGSSLRGRDREPVVHVAYEDALTYARWRGRDLPTEAEWEYAARGGLEGARYPWGDAPSTAQAPKANHWQGSFPALDVAGDGYKVKAAPVGCFPANGFGLFDMAGNVWEWTRDWYRPGVETKGENPTGPGAARAVDPFEPGSGPPKHVIKGGSFLCSDDFCFRYRPAARQPGPPDTGASHVGFRTVKRGQESELPGA